jgi:hypothetical protein
MVRLPWQFYKRLIRCSARVVLAAGDADLVCVGRSPESIYDFLAGAFETTTWRERVQLLQLSLRSWPPEEVRRQRKEELAHLKSYFERLRLTPGCILQRERPVAFVDLVYEGKTFGNLLGLLHTWTGPERWPEVLERLRWVCLVADDSKVPAWKPESSPWTGQLAPDSIRRVQLDLGLWAYLANEQPKTTDRYPANRWGSASSRRPSEDPDRVRAARLARTLFRLGERRRPRLAVALCRSAERPAWLGQLIRELRTG